MSRPIAAAMAIGGMMAALAGCSATPETADSGVRSDLIRIVVARDENGAVDPAPAYEEANRRCRETFDSAVYFMGEDVGSNERMLYFRCQ